MLPQPQLVILLKLSGFEVKCTYEKYYYTYFRLVQVHLRIFS